MPRLYRGKVYREDGYMKEEFHKFTRTPHLTVLGDVDIRDDKLMSEFDRNKFLSHEVVIEEKIDGANLGVSFDMEGNIRAQNRGAYLPLPYTGQWKKLSEWLTVFADKLFDQLSDRYILYGEWCYAQHSISYDRLPDWFLGFDIFDKLEMKFFSCTRRNDVFQELCVTPAPLIKRGYFTLAEIQSFLSSPSQVGRTPAEGLYLRFDQGDWLVKRAKLVRPTFIQSVGQHWTRTAIKVNRLR